MGCCGSKDEDKEEHTKLVIDNSANKIEIQQIPNTNDTTNNTAERKEEAKPKQPSPYTSNSYDTFVSTRSPDKKPWEEEEQHDENKDEHVDDGDLSGPIQQQNTHDTATSTKYEATVGNLAFDVSLPTIDSTKL